MKKLFNVFIILSVLFCAVAATGCGDVLEPTYNTWYKYEGTFDIPLGSDTSEDADSLLNLKNSELYVYYDADEGLTVAVQSTKEQDVELLGGLTSYTVDMIIGGQKTYTKEKGQFGPGRWTALMLLGTFEESNTPEIVKNPEQCIDLSEGLQNGIQWKKVLKKILIQQLLGDL